MKKIIYMLFFSLFISIIFLVIGSSYDSESTVIYESTGVVSERRSGKSVTITLDDDSKVETLLMHSNILNIGDKVDLKYYKSKTKYKISEIKIVIDDKNKDYFANRVLKDPLMYIYSGKIQINEKPIEAIVYPEQIKDQKIIALSPKDMIQYYTQDKSLKEKETYSLSIDEEINIKSFLNIKDSKERKVSYSYNYKYQPNKISFESLNGGTYIIKVKLNDGSILSYIFT